MKIHPSKVRRPRARELRALDAEAEVKANRIIDEFKAGMARAEAMLAEYQVRVQAGELREELSLQDLPMEDAVRLVRARRRELLAKTDAERRRAQVEWMSVIGSPVDRIAEKTGLSYLYVVQLRRRLGLSPKRSRSKK